MHPSALHYFPLPPLFMLLLGAVLILVITLVAPLAYIAGSVGTLPGADVLNLRQIQQLGAPVASIGGAGVSDGVFLAGIVAVLLA